MNYIYPAIISFLIIFIAELGDKTQLLVLSFSNKNSTKTILFGIILGTFFSHGLGILLGTKIHLIFSDSFTYYLKLFSSLSFIFLGLIGFIYSFRKKYHIFEKSNNTIFSFILKQNLSPIFLIGLSIFIGEIGDKTFISSITLGTTFPSYKVSLIVGSILGMVLSNIIAIFLR